MTFIRDYFVCVAVCTVFATLWFTVWKLITPLDKFGRPKVENADDSSKGGDPDVAKERIKKIYKLDLEPADEKEILDQLVESLEPYNITEIMRTGKMSMRKGKTHNVSLDKNNVKSEQEKWQPEKINLYHN